MAKYDYLIIGSGLFGSVFAHEAVKLKKKVLVLERRPHIGGNLYCQRKNDIWLHYYGAHIFHTNSKLIWDYVNHITEFKQYIHMPLANYKGQIYNLPFNMHTFYQMWGTTTPEQARKKIDHQKKALAKEPQNLEEQALASVGEELYLKLIKGYTEKQWGRPCKELPPFILNRIPLRYRYDNNYFNCSYQGIPLGGYNPLIEGLLEGSEIILGEDFNEQRSKYEHMSHKLIYTGPIDAYFNYCYGQLAYRSLSFKSELLEIENYQGTAVMNFTDRETPYTRIIEHKHFEFANQPVTWITKEYPLEWTIEKEAYYPINDLKNQALYKKYAQLAKNEKNVLFGGRLAQYRYYDMDQIIEQALTLAHLELKGKKENMDAKNIGNCSYL